MSQRGGLPWIKIIKFKIAIEIIKNTSIMTKMFNSLEDTAISLAEFLSEEKVLFITYQPDIFDFKKYQGSLVIHSRNQTLTLPLTELSSTFIGMLTQSVFNEEIKVISWDIKKLISLFKYNLSSTYPIEIKSKIYDLKLLEKFLRINKPCPTSWLEAINRIKLLLDNKNLLTIHEKIHIPLSLDVIPSIETEEFIDIEEKNKKFTYYEIEGQINGRMQSSSPSSDYICVHNLSSEKKDKLQLGFDDIFMLFDYKNNEVSVLQWLSNDECLGKILNSDGDCYSLIYELICKKPCDTPEKRKLIKDSFLPVVYGSQVASLAESIGKPLDAAMFLIDSYNEHFSTALSWVSSQEKEFNERGILYDYFGRPKKDLNNPWMVRNAVIQGVAAVFCLEKLIELKKYLTRARIIASLHDGYLLRVDMRYKKDVIRMATDILESSSEMCPGLLLKTHCFLGKKWSELEEWKS